MTHDTQGQPYTRDDLRAIAQEIDADVHIDPDPHSIELMVVAMQRMRDMLLPQLAAAQRRVSELEALWPDDDIYDAINKVAFTAMHKGMVARFVSDVAAAEMAIDIRDAIQRQAAAQLAEAQRRASELEAEVAALKSKLTETRVELSGTEAAWDELEEFMFDEEGDDDE